MYDVVVIGGGPAGEKCSGILAKAGKNVCLIEKGENHIGGTCLNEGCIPAKLYLESVSYLGKKSYLQSCGLQLQNISFDMNVLKDKKEELISQIRKGATLGLRRDGVEVKYGTATFVDKNSIKVGDEIITASHFVIATGSIHRPHPLLEVDKEYIISSDEVFKLKEPPKSILIVGGGAIGCEFATFFHNLGSNVHIAEFTPNLVPAEDKDIADALKRELSRKGIRVSLSTSVSDFAKGEDEIIIKMQTQNGEIKDSYDLVLVSIGRMPNTYNLNLKNANIESKNSYIEVDENLKTTNPKVYALGDVVPTPALAHVAYNEAKVVANNILNDEKIKPSKVIPFVTFCQPQVASVGLNEKTLNEQGVEYEVVKSFFKSNAKAKIKGDDGGFIKLICQKESGVIIGGAMIGNDTTELVHELLIAINAKLTKDDLKDMVFAHPTLSELLWSMLQ